MRTLPRRGVFSAKPAENLVRSRFFSKEVGNERCTLLVTRRVCGWFASYLRHDSLAQVLAYANVRSGADLIVAESCNGFITGCVAEKMGGVCVGGTTGFLPRFGGRKCLCPRAGCGRIFNVHPMFRPNLVYFKQFNVRCDVNQLVIGVPIDTLTGKPPSKPVYVYEPRVPASGEEPTTVPSASASPPPEPGDAVSALAGESANADTAPVGKSNKKKRSRNVTADDETRAAWRLEAQKAPATALLHLRTYGADGLIIVVDSHPLALVLQLVRYLKPSSPFVVFSRFLEPLAECFRQLKHYGLATRLAINETWTRHYQACILLAICGCGLWLSSVT
jgi:tRNA (adenine58-N1)-methyltransferase non-catalytic subunit